MWFHRAYLRSYQKAISSEWGKAKRTKYLHRASDSVPINNVDSKMVGLDVLNDAILVFDSLIAGSCINLR